MFLTFIHYLLLFLLGVLAVPVLYLLVLTAAAWRAQRQTTIGTEEPATRFAILIPAHNEEKLLPACLESLRGLDYPAGMFRIWVVADNCSDRTAELARRLGANVTERVDLTRIGKGYALQWGLRALREASAPPPGAVIILDADSSISANFLRVMAARLERGERIIQAYYSVRGSERSWSENLRYIALAALHYLRPQGRSVLGGSAGLKGNGMVFAGEILDRHNWTSSLTEDIEFHMTLLLAGEKVTYAPDAVVWGEMPDSLSGAASQVERWERGRIEMARRYVPRLVSGAWRALRRGQRRQAYTLLDAVLEHLIPPFSILAGFCGLGMLAAVVLFVISETVSTSGVRTPYQTMSLANLILGGSLTLGLVFYVFSGLRMARAPVSAYRALLFAPIFVGWKLWHALRLIRPKAKPAWVRTARNR